MAECNRYQTPWTAVLDLNRQHTAMMHVNTRLCVAIMTFKRLSV